jgi:predicted nucleotide-binding protein
VTDSPATSDDFLDRLGLSADARAIMVRSAREFEHTNDWVSFDTLAYEAADRDQTFDLNAAFRLPSILGGVWSGEKVSLTALGVVLAGTAPHTSDVLARLARVCAERKLRFKEEAKVSASILMQEYGFDLADARRSETLVNMIPGVASGGQLGDDWWLNIHRTALDYRHVETIDDLRLILQQQAMDRITAHQQAMAVAPLFAEAAALSSPFGQSPTLQQARSQPPEPDDPAAVFVVHGRDEEALAALFEFLEGLGLHPLEWDELVAQTGQGTPFIGQVLDAAFARAQAVVVLMTPDDEAQLHRDLVQPGEAAYEQALMCQPRPNVLFEAGMAFGFNPTRTIIVELGTLRPVTDLAGRHVVRLGTAKTLQSLATRLEAAGCPIDKTSSAISDTSRFSELAAHRRQAASP